MPNQQINRIAEHLCECNLGKSARDRTDRELLDSFRKHEDELAFTTLVERHGTMVFGVCQRVLRNRHDAEDACQATFLILAQKADSIQKKDSLGSWLHGVAFRVAWNLKHQLARHAAKERNLEGVLGGDVEKEVTWREVQAALDEELGQLAERFRAPLILCYLEGRTQDEAARQLGWSLGTLRGRVARGRALLLAKLTRRGITLSVALLGAVSQVKTALAHSITQNAMQITAEPSSSTTIVSERVASLLQGGLSTTMLKKSKIGVAFLFLIATVILGGGLVACYHLAAHENGSEASRGPGRQTPTDEPDQQSLPPNALARLGTLHLRQGAKVSSVAFSPDGSLLASGSEDGETVLRDAKTGTKLHTLREQDGRVNKVAFSPDGTRLATAGDQRSKNLVIWDTQTHKKLLEVQAHTGMIYDIAFSSDGKRIATAGQDRKVRLWNTQTGAEQSKPVNLSGEVYRLWFSPGLRYLATLEQEKDEKEKATYVAYIRDASTGKALHKHLVHSEAMVSFSANDKLYVVLSNGEIVLRTTATGKQLRSIAADPKRPTALALSKDHQTLFVGSLDGTIRSYNLRTGQPTIESRPHTDRVRGLALSPNGKVLASAGNDNRIQLTDASTGNVRFTREGHLGEVLDATYSADGQVIVTASKDGSVIVWDAHTRKELRRLVGPTHKILSLAIAADGKTLVTGSQDSKVRIWDLETGKMLRLIQVDYAGKAVALSPDGKTILLGGYDGSVRLWRTDTGDVRLVKPKFIEKGPVPYDAEALIVASSVMLPNSVLSVAYSPDGATFVATSYREVVLWDATTLQVRWREPVPKVGRAAEVCYAPDSRTLALVSRSSGEVQIREVATGLLRSQFTLESKPLLGVQFSHKGRMLGIGSDRGVAHLYDVGTGKSLRALTGHLSKVDHVGFSPDDQQLVTAGADTTAMVWDISDVRVHARKIESLTAIESESLWDALLESRDGAKVQRSIELLKSAPVQATALFRRHLVRKGFLTATKEISRWITKLDADEFKVREQAMVALERVGSLAKPELQRALQGSPSAEARQRIRRLLTKLETSHTVKLTYEQVRQSRALEVLEHLTTDEARKLIGELARGAAGPWLANEAKAVLGRTVPK